MKDDMCEICQNWARTDGKLTNHHPNCLHYNDSLIDIWKITRDKTYFYTDKENIAGDILLEDYNTKIEKIKMHKEIFEHLDEFEGF